MIFNNLFSKYRSIRFLSISSKVIFILLSFILCGCQKITPEINNLSNINDIESLIKNEDQVILEISKKPCPYCEIMNKLETEIQFNHSVTFYKYTINDSTTSQDLDTLKNILKNLKYAPTFYYIKSGKIIDTLNIQDWQSPKNEFRDWIKNKDSK